MRKRKGERGKEKEERGKRKGERGKEKEEMRKRKGKRGKENFEIRTDHLIPARRPDQKSKKKKRENLPYNGCCLPIDPYSKNKGKRKDLARQLRKVWNMGVTVILVVTGTLGTVPKRSERRLEELEIGGRIETIQTTVLLRSTRILRRVLET